MCRQARFVILLPSNRSPISERNLIMNKRIRIAFAALLIAFAVAFSAIQLGGFSQFDMAGIGVKPIASIKPPKGVVFVLGLVANEQWPDWSRREP
jgi:hypothetical protein